MKICLVADGIPGLHNEWSGAEMVCVRLAEALQSINHEIVFLTNKVDVEECPENVEEIYVPFVKRFALLIRNLPIEFVSLFQVYRKLRKIKPDLVHIYSKDLFTSALISSKILRIPVLLTVVDYFNFCTNLILRRPDWQICERFHGPQCIDCFPRSDKPFWKSKKKWVPILLQKLFYALRAWVFDYYASKIDTWIVFSETSKGRLRRYRLPDNKMAIIYPYRLKPEMIQYADARGFHNPLKILFAGSVDANKGTHIAIEAVKYVLEEVPNANLTIVGPEEKVYFEKVKNMVKELGMEDHVSFLGKKSNDEIIRIISEHDIATVPVQWPNDFGPVILIEEMALGKPIIASRIGAIPEFMKDGENGLLATHNTPKEFAEKILWFIKNEDKAIAMGQKAKESVDFLYRDDLGIKMGKIYEQLLGKV